MYLNRIFFTTFAAAICNFFSIMTKLELINEISARTGVQKREVTACVDSFMEVVKDTMCNDENVYLRGFGTFLVKERKAKTARNITKNITITVPAHKIPDFKPVKPFLDRMKELK